MKTIKKNLFFAVIIAAIFALAINIPAARAESPDDCDVDTARIAVVELTVHGMDSLSVNDVQDVLDATCGVSFNFACWNDTVVFIEYDSLLTSKHSLMAVIKNMGYHPSVKLEY